MHKPEIKPLVALIGSSSQIMLLLLLTHNVPLGISLLINPDIKPFRTDEQSDIVARKSDQHLVAGEIIRFVWRAIDVRSDNLCFVSASVQPRIGIKKEEKQKRTLEICTAML